MKWPALSVEVKAGRHDDLLVIARGEMASIALRADEALVLADRLVDLAEVLGRREGGDENDQTS